MNNIKIFTRIKPNINNNADTCVFKQNNSVIVKKKQKAYLQNYIVDCNYKLDKVFDDKCENRDIYNYISIEILKNIIKHNKNVTFYVYGQTGSGKTHTITILRGGSGGAAAPRGKIIIEEIVIVLFIS